MLDDTPTVLVRCPNWVGDVVAATPAFDCLRRNLPNARLIAVIRHYAQGVIESGPWFDAVIGCDDKSWGGFFALVNKIRRVRPDLAVVMPNSLRATLGVFLGGASAIYGYRRGVRRLLLSGGPAPLHSRTGSAPPDDRILPRNLPLAWVNSPCEPAPEPLFFPLKRRAGRPICWPATVSNPGIWLSA